MLTAAARVSGVVETVPAARTVLVRFDPLVTTVEAVGHALESAVRAPDADPAPDPVELGVEYDGPDLDDVAGELGISPAELVRRHAAGDYTVAFCGFAPGFAYLTGLDPALHVGRAGRTAYARATGIGRRRRRIHRRLSALLPRWLATARAHRRSTVGHRAHAAGTADAGHAGAVPAGMIEVLEPGPFASVQDGGRGGYAGLGVARSGAFDRAALGLANRLVGNPATARAASR